MLSAPSVATARYHTKKYNVPSFKDRCRSGERLGGEPFPQLGRTPEEQAEAEHCTDRRSRYDWPKYVSPTSIRSCIGLGPSLNSQVPPEDAHTRAALMRVRSFLGGSSVPRSSAVHRTGSGLAD